MRWCVVLASVVVVGGLAAPCAVEARGGFGGGGGSGFRGGSYHWSGGGDRNVNNNFYNRDSNGWNDGWRNGGYWGANAAAWGVASLATGAVIGGLVNAASAQQSPVFLVPNTSYQLNYGSVEAVGSTGVSFTYGVNGTQLLGAANCQQGLLNGQIPTDADQAQLLNAVCQVAYGSGS